MKRLKYHTSGLTFRVLAGVLLLLLCFGFAVLQIGYHSFLASYTRVYNDSAYHTAQTALSVIRPDEFESYLACQGEADSYRQSQRILDNICQTQDVTLLYVITVEEDYNHILSVFNLVNKDSPFTPWEVGFRRETTNNEYKQIYQDIYENGLDQAYIVRTDHLGDNEAHITTLVPALGSDGQVKGIVCVQRPMEELERGLSVYLRRIILTTLLVQVLVFALSLYLLSRHFVLPIQRVTQEAQRFARENTPCPAPLIGQVGDIREFQTLSSAIEKMEEDNLSYVKNLTTITAEKERISTELNLARRIQDNSLFTDFPDTDQLSLYAKMTPARAVGGDFYDFFFLDEDHLCVTIADVAGKGIPAALFMMMAKILMESYAKQGGSPGKILENVNEQICRHNTVEMFLTAWIGILTISTGQIISASAGHEIPVLQNPDGSFQLNNGPHGFVLGGMEGMKYPEYSFTLEKGCSLFLYTDGLAEATDKDNQLFGVGRILEVLNQSPSKNSPSDMLHSMDKAVADFVGEAPQFDDLTMLGLMRKGESTFKKETQKQQEKQKKENQKRKRNK